jgi:hypothetical protein
MKKSGLWTEAVSVALSTMLGLVALLGLESWSLSDILKALLFAVTAISLSAMTVVHSRSKSTSQSGKEEDADD